MSLRRRKLGTVVGPHHMTSRAGMTMLKAGGNAVDAAVAAAFTSGVVDPASNGVAGYGGCLVIFLAKSRRVVAIDCNTVAPVAASERMLTRPASRHRSTTSTSKKVPVRPGTASAAGQTSTVPRQLAFPELSPAFVWPCADTARCP